MKTLVIGDIHIKVSNITDIDCMTEKLIELAQKTQPDFIVVLGDILDRHSSIHLACLMRAETLLLALSKISPTFLLIGNHDRPNNSNFLTNEHAFNSLKLWPGTFVIDTVQSFIFKKDISNNVQIRSGNKIEDEGEFKFVFAPYVAPGRLDEALNTIENPHEDTICFFLHQEFVNAKMGCIISTVGDNWPLKNSLAVSGHIHDADRLQPNIIYTGVPIMHTFSDRPDKCVSFFTFEKDKDFIHERIDLGLIKKTTVYLTPEQVSSYNPPEDKLVKLVIRGDEASIRTIAKIDHIQVLKKKGVKVVFKTIQDQITTSDGKFVQKMSFRDRLLSDLRQDTHSLKWFNLLF